MAHALLSQTRMWTLRASLVAAVVALGAVLLSTAHGCTADDTPGDLTDDTDDDGADAGPEEVDAGPDAEDADAGTGADADAGPDEVDAGTAAEEVDAGPGEGEGEGEVEGYYSEDPEEFFGATRCPSFVELCEDFEDGLPTSRWTLVIGSDAVIGVDSVQAARGASALHVTLPPVPTEAYLRNTSLFPRDDGVIWGRLFFFVNEPGPDNFVHYNLVEATGPGAGTTKLVRYGGVAVRDLANAFDFDNWLFNFEQRPRPDGFDELAIREDGQHIDRGAWRCMEWVFDSVSTEAHVFRDGVEVVDSAAASPLEGVEFTMPSFDGIHIGFAHYQNIDRGFDVWIDGLALDDERIGCSN